MPRKNAGPIAVTDSNGNASMLSSAPSETPKQASPKQQKDQTQEKPTGTKKKNEADFVSLDDLLLPRTLINRIARGVLPANTSIQRDAILALTKSATVFISHLAAEANEMTDRKTIQSADVLKALQEIEFAQVMNIGVMGKDGKRGGRVEREIELWENNVRGKRRGYRDKVKARDSAGGADTTVDNSIAVEEEEEDGDEHQNKRRKRDSEEVMIEGGHHDVSALSDGTTNGRGDATSKTGKPAAGDNMAAADEDDADDVDDTEDDEEEEEEDDEQLDEEEGDEQEESQDMEDSLDADGTTRRKHEMLAPNGRVEVVDSDDDDDESE